jgi:hypothetical protein
VRTSTLIRLIVLSALAFVGGLTMVQNASRETKEAQLYRKPVAVAFDEFVRRDSKRGLFRITGGTLNLTKAVYVRMARRHASDEEPGWIADAYIPVESPNDPVYPTPIRIVILTEDPEIIQTINELRGLSGSNDPKDKTRQQAWLKKNYDRVFLRRDIVGVPRSIAEITSSQKKDLASFTETFAPNFVFIEDGDVPTVKRADVRFRVGLILIALPALFWLGCFGVFLFGRFQERSLHLAVAGVNLLASQDDGQTYTFRSKDDVLCQSVDAITIRQMLRQGRVDAETLMQSDNTNVICPLKLIPTLNREDA